LFIGAAFGRLYALFVQDTMGVGGLSAYGTYSLIGAASVLGGYTRMTVTVVVMIAEASGDASIVVPLMLAVMLARWIANFFAECYDEKMMELRHIPFLHDECSDDKAHDTANTVMNKATTIRSRESVSNLKKLLEARNAHYSAFPVVDENGALLGLVPGLVLEKTLKEAGFHGEDAEADLSIPMNQIMDPSPYTVRVNFPLHRVFPLIKKLHIEHLVVTDMSGLPVGVIPRTNLVAADGGHVSTLHNKVMNKLDFNKSGMKMRCATVKSKSNDVMYETGELYDDEIAAKRNIRKLSSWLYKPDKAFQERNERDKGAGSGSGYELAQVGEGKEAAI
jgi:chloride channel 7